MREHYSNSKSNVFCSQRMSSPTNENSVIICVLMGSQVMFLGLTKNLWSFTAEQCRGILINIGSRWGLNVSVCFFSPTTLLHLPFHQRKGAVDDD